jgi:hypothetical protein
MSALTCEALGTLLEAVQKLKDRSILLDDAVKQIKALKR